MAAIAPKTRDLNRDKNLNTFIELTGLADPSITRFPVDVAKVVTNYVEDTDRFSGIESWKMYFGARDWKRHFGVDVGPPPRLPPAHFYYNFWIGPDPIDPYKKVWETHLPPVLCPEYVKFAGLEIPFTLNTLEYLIQYPRKGPASRYSISCDTIELHGDTRTGPSHWLVLRKDLLGRDLTYDQQKEELLSADYEEMPSLTELVTVIFATHMKTGGKHHFSGTPYCIDSWTHSRCIEHVDYIESYPVAVGRLFHNELDIDADFFDKSPSAGVAAIRKF